MEYAILNLLKRIEDLEKIVKELVEYKEDRTMHKSELIDGQIVPVGYYTHEYKARFLDKDLDEQQRKLNSRIKSVIGYRLTCGRNQEAQEGENDGNS